MGFSIEDGTPALCDAVARKVAGLPLLTRYGMTGEWLAQSLESALERPGESVIVACEAVKPVGFAWFLPRGTFATGGYLRLIAVAPACQSRGVGAELLAEVERRVADHSRTLFLLVSDFNTAAQRFYAAHGYRQGGRLEAFVKADIDELIYWKRIG